MQRGISRNHYFNIGALVQEVFYHIFIALFSGLMQCMILRIPGNRERNIATKARLYVILYEACRNNVRES